MQMSKTRGRGKRQQYPIFVLPQQNKNMVENNITISVDALLNSIQNFERKYGQDIKYFIIQFNETAEADKISDELWLIFLKSKLAG